MSLHPRIKRLEKAARASWPDRRNSTAYRQCQCIAQLILDECADYRLVEPQDTDPATYAEIQETIAVAEGRYDDADRWRKEADKSNPEQPGSTAALQWRIEQLLARELSGHDRVDDAIAAARRRLGHPVTIAEA